MPSSLTPKLSSRLSSFSSPAATSMVVTESTKQLAWQVAVYLAVSLVVTAVICGTILLIWNDDWTALILRRLKFESVRSAGSTLVQWMLCYFFATSFLAFQRLRRAAAAPRPQSDLPLFRRPALQEPLLAVPPLAMLHGNRSFRVPPNLHSNSEPSILSFLCSEGTAP